MGRRDVRVGRIRTLLVLREAFEARGLPEPRVSLASDIATFRLRAVVRCDLLGIAVRSNIEKMAERRRLTILPVKRSDWIRRVAAVYRKDAYLSAAARRLIEILKTECRAISRA